MVSLECYSRCLSKFPSSWTNKLGFESCYDYCKSPEERTAAVMEPFSGCSCQWLNLNNLIVIIILILIVYFVFGS